MTSCPSARRDPPGRAGGYTLIEVMIGTTLSLVLLAGLSAMFVNNMRARDEVERANQQIESGRYAMQVISDDLQLAGYWGELDFHGVRDGGEFAVPAAPPDACDVTVANLNSAMVLHVQGIDGYATGDLDCIDAVEDVVEGTDVVVVRRASTCVAGDANCVAAPAADDGTPWFQASLCSTGATGGTELLDTNELNWFRVDSDPTELDRHARDCAAEADVRRYITHIYFVSIDHTDFDGNGTPDEVPTLKRAELGAGVFTIAPLASGIQNLQIVYGIDDTPMYPDGDGIPDTYAADPVAHVPAFTACPGAAPPVLACHQVENWQNVVAAKVYVLSRSVDRSAGYSDTKTYTLGDGNTVGPFNDSYKRHAFQSAIRLMNPAGRRE